MPSATRLRPWCFPSYPTVMLTTSATASRWPARRRCRTCRRLRWGHPQPRSGEGESWAIGPSGTGGNVAGADNSSPTRRAGPLAGVRVVDLTAMVMGPYCTQIMADMGADVIKVEAPQGDDTRYISVGPAPGMSGVFVNVNRGKRSIVLDLHSEAGKVALRALIATADIFIHSMRAKAIARVGFGYDHAAA